LPRLSLVNKAKLFDNNDLFFVNSLNKYEIDGLLMAGVKTAHPNGNLWYKCKTLTITSPLINDSTTNPDGCRYLRDNFIPRRESNIEKIVIGRRTRKIENSDKVYEYLNKIGYKTIFCEDYSFEDQIALFKGVKYIVSPHGAGLSNIVFCGKGTKVLEILSPRYVNACFRKVAAYSELDYYFLFGEGDISLEEDMNSAIVVDIEKLKRTLELMKG
jgi:capsular polysaccharide biosynthesis protein